MFQELELVQDHNFFFPCQTCPFRWGHLARMKHYHLCLQTGVAVAVPGKVSLKQPHQQLEQSVLL